MTAITTTTRRTDDNNNNNNAPLHAVASSSTAVATAKTKFMDATKHAILELQRQHGYSRERATALLLRELKRGDGASPGDNEIFCLMQRHGIGMEDASRALIVSRAVQRGKVERGLSAVDAIEDLTSRLSVSRLLKTNHDKTNDFNCKCSADESSAPEVRNTNKVVDHVAATDAASSPQRAPPQRKTAKRTSKASKMKKSTKHLVANNNKSIVNVKQQSGRKRSINEDKNTKGHDVVEATTNRRVRADSVSEVEMQKKAKMSSPEETPSADSPTRGLVKSPTPIVATRKRGHRGDESQGTTGTPMKRARTTEL